MPTVSDVKLDILAGPSDDKRTVKVTGKVGFDVAEVGKKYLLEIGLMGEDSSSDNLAPGDSVIHDSLYSFTWASLLGPRPSTAITGTASPLTVDESRTIALSKLDEDAGGLSVNEPGIPDIPRKDEVYAVVSVNARVSGKSPAEKAGGVL